MEVSGQIHASVTSPPGKNRRYPLNRKLVGHQNLLDFVWRTLLSLASLGNRNRGGTAHGLANKPTSLAEVVDGFMIHPNIVFYIPSRACRRHHWKANYRFCGAAIFFVQKLPCCM
jgi:hypothetical protein